MKDGLTLLSHLYYSRRVGESDLRVVCSYCILFEPVTQCENSSTEMDDTERSEP